MGNLAATDSLVALKVKVLKSGDSGPDGRYLVVADATKAALLKVGHNLPLQPQPGQSVVLFNILVREDRLVTISKTAMFWCKEVTVPDSVTAAAPQIPTDATSSDSSSLSQAVSSPKGIRVDVKGRVVKVCTCTYAICLLSMQLV